MYDKSLLTALFARYCETGGDEDFMALISACEGLVKVVVDKYSAFAPWADDITQEVQIALWMGLRNHQRLQKELASPVTFLYYRVWGYLYNSLKRYAKTYHISMKLTEREERIIHLHDKEGLSYSDIAREMDMDKAAVSCCYHIGKTKPGISHISLDEAGPMAEQGCNPLLDPCKQYEVREIMRIFEDNLCDIALERYGLYPGALEEFVGAVGKNLGEDLAEGEL